MIVTVHLTLLLFAMLGNGRAFSSSPLLPVWSGEDRSIFPCFKSFNTEILLCCHNRWMFTWICPLHCDGCVFKCVPQPAAVAREAVASPPIDARECVTERTKTLVLQSAGSWCCTDPCPLCARQRHFSTCQNTGKECWPPWFWSHSRSRRCPEWS